MRKGNLKSIWFLILTAFISLTFIKCQDPSSVASDDNLTTKQAITSLLDEDSAIASFEPNFNEDGLMDMLGKVSTEIYPLKVGHKMKLTNHNVNLDIQGDTAYALITNTFAGQLFIAASYDPAATQPDTLIKKDFTSVVTRKAILVKIDSTLHPKRNWLVVAVSLPEGGTLNPSVDIKKLTVYLPEDTLVITSPNDYYLLRKPGFRWKWKNFPELPQNQNITVQLEINSAYADTDFVTITFGANLLGMHRTKKKFEMVSSNFNGTTYDKVYEQTFNTHRVPGFFHSVINALPLQTIKDDSTPVEMDSWGVPYFVKQ